MQEEWGRIGMVEQEGQRYDHRHQGNIEYEGEVDIQERVDKQYVQSLAAPPAVKKPGV